MTESIEAVLSSAVIQGRIPGIVCAISKDFDEPHIFEYGRTSHLTSAEAVSRETYFDLASVTKVVTTHQWLLALVSSDQIDLYAPIGDYLTNVAPWLERCPIWRLSNHTSGLPAHVEFFRDFGHDARETGTFDAAKELVLKRIRSHEPAYKMGSQLVYSDLGYILLGQVLGRCSRPLPEYWSCLYGHDADETLHWRPSRGRVEDSLGRQYAATEDCAWRDRLIVGEVHDDNCWTMGGLAGHAGTFGRVGDVHRIGVEFLRLYQGNPSSLRISSEVLHECFHPRFQHPNSDRVLGWETPTPGRSSTGRYFSPQSFGHLGFTGTSLWIDPAAQVVVTVLSNRVCPTRENTAIKSLRPRLHDALRRYINR